MDVTCKLRKKEPSAGFDGSARVLIPEGRAWVYEASEVNLHGNVGLPRRCTVPSVSSRPPSSARHPAAKAKMFATLATCALALASVIPSVLGNITIAGPSDKAYWVQFTENNITWSYKQGDPSPISIFISNAEQNLLNGEFSIAEYLDSSIQQFTVTNVTLVQGSGFVVNFVNPKNFSEIYASSKPFEVKPEGTAPANLVSDDALSSASQNGGATQTQDVGNPQGTAPTGGAATLAVSSAVLLASSFAVLLI